MTAEDFKTFAAHLRDPGTETDAGYYPTMPWNVRIAALWFKHLQRYTLAYGLRALEVYAMAEPLHPPSLDAFLARVKDLLPPPVAPWHQFAPAQLDAMRDGSYGGVLHSLLPDEGVHAWARCWCWLFEQGYTKPGREAACAQECRKLAAQYPDDRARWEQEAGKLEARAQAVPQRRDQSIHQPIHTMI